MDQLVLGVVVYPFNPSRQRQKLVDLCMFEASLVYMPSSKITRAM